MGKKWSMVVLIFIISSLLLAGCGSSATPSTTPSSGTPATPSSTTPTPSNTAPAKATTNMDEAIDTLINKSRNVEGLYFEYVTEGNVGGTGSMKMWWTKKAQKIEMIDPTTNQGITMITDHEAKVAYMLQPEQKMAMKMPIEQNAATTEIELPFDMLGKVDTDFYKVLETSTLNGVQCKVLVPKDNNIASALKVWISEEHGVPIRVETTDGDQKWAVEYRNLKVGPIAPETFKVPEGYQVMDLTKLP